MLKKKSGADLRSVEEILQQASLQDVLEERRKYEESKMRLLTQKLTQLKATNEQVDEFDMSQYALQVLPKSFLDIQSLTQSLTSLKLAENQLAKFCNSKVLTESFPNLTKIDLSSNDLTVFPKCLLNMPKMTSIIMANNEIKEIPSEISKLRQLEVLNLHNNKITKLPKKLNTLHHLKVLVLSSNPIVGSVDLLGLARLERLSLADCKVREILSQSFETLTKLEQLDLSRNFLTSFPAIPSSCNRLVEIDLGTNSISSISDASFLAIPSVCTINLSFNRLTSLPSTIGSITNLMRLRVTNNLLTALPEEIVKCEKLVEIDVTANALVSLPSDFHKMKKLRRLFLAENKLTKLNQKLTQLKLERCLVRTNPWVETDPHTFDVLQNWREQCIKSRWGFDWASSLVEELVLDVGGMIVKRKAFRQHVHYETPEGEVLHPHSVRTLKAASSYQEYLRQQFAKHDSNSQQSTQSVGQDTPSRPVLDIDRPMEDVLAEHGHKRHTRRTSIDWASHSEHRLVRTGSIS